MVNVKVTRFCDVMTFSNIERYVTPRLKELCTQLHKATCQNITISVDIMLLVLLPNRPHLLKLHGFETRVPKIDMIQCVFPEFGDEWIKSTVQGIKFA